MPIMVPRRQIHGQGDTAGRKADNGKDYTEDSAESKSSRIEQTGNSVLKAGRHSVVYVSERIGEQLSVKAKVLTML